MNKESDKERRVGVVEMQTDIALIKQKSEFFEDKIKEIGTDVKELKELFSGNNVLKKDVFDNHIVQDRWMFGVLLTLLVCIFGKLIHG